MGITSFVESPKLEVYKEKYKEHFVIERKDGIIMLRAHTQGRSVLWGPEIHRAIHQALRDVGSDPENEVLIFTGTGKYWIGHMAESGKDTDFDEAKNRQWGSYNIQYIDGTKIQENLIFDLEIPTIGAINGPGFHSEMLLMCDLTICTEDTIILDPHMKAGLVPGDGIHCALQELLNQKRANYAMLTCHPIDAKKALEWGLVNEVVPKDKIYERAWELGRELMQVDRIQRRIATQVLRKPWKRRLAEDLHGGFASEMFAYNVTDTLHKPEARKKLLQDAGIEVDER